MSAPDRLDRICIVMMSAVGDAVHVLPVINALKSDAAGVPHHVGPAAGPATLVRGHRSVDEIMHLRSRAGHARRSSTSGARSRGDAFDLVINLQVYFKAGIVTTFTRAPVKLGFDRARARDLNWLFTTHRIPPQPSASTSRTSTSSSSTHLASRTSRWSGTLGRGRTRRRGSDEFFAKIDRPAAAIVVATSKPEKDWMPERWARLPIIVRATTDCSRCSSADGRRGSWLPSRRFSELRAASARLGARQRAAESRRDSIGSALVLSPDTGPLHMAVALDRPVISLMGYTNPKRTGPYRKFHDLMIDAYGDPGEDYPLSMETRPDRMPRIQVRDVLDKVDRWRAQYRDRRRVI